jgi:hypothetical protein
MAKSQFDLARTLEEFTDYLMPELTPYESAMYVFLFRNTYLKDSEPKTRMGQRTIAKLYGKGPRMSVPSIAHIKRAMETLEEKGCIRIDDTTREGTLYEVLLPSEIPSVIEKMTLGDIQEGEDYYDHSEKRQELFERDRWICQYCGEKVSVENVTLDHFIPRHLGGSNKKENLRTACLLCNSIKSGKSYEEAAMYLLKSIQERKKRSAEGL